MTENNPVLHKLTNIYQFTNIDNVFTTQANLRRYYSNI